MGREIRRVPPGWIHPTNALGRHIPLYDEDYETVAAEWTKNNQLWQRGEHPDQKEYDDTPLHFRDWDGDKPMRKFYRPKWAEEERTHYQIYENVSEGTPVSPIFASLDEMKKWLIAARHSEYAATKFCEIGHAPSMVFTPGRGISGLGIHSLDHLNDTD